MLDVNCALALISATAVSFIFHKLKLPVVLGFMVTGVLLGPFGFKLIANVETISGMAELGIIFLLFMVGLELSPDKIKKMKLANLLGGVGQLLLTTIAFAGLLMLFKAPTVVAFVLGGVLSLSSTALVMKSIEEKGEKESGMGRLTLGTLIVQDIAVIPLLTFVPLLGEVMKYGTFNLPVFALGIVKAFGMLGLTVLLSTRVIPFLMDKLAHTGNRELFTISVFSLGVGMSFLTAYLGLSPEAGAFVAGIALSGSIYCKQVISDTRPFRDVFASLFFISLGGLLNFPFIQANFISVGCLLLMIVSVKMVMSLVAFRASGFSWHSTILTSVCLFQVGELSFMVMHTLQKTVKGAPRIEAWLSQWDDPIINAIILSMFLTPLMVSLVLGYLAPFISQLTQKLDKKEMMKTHGLNNKIMTTHTNDSVILVGYGPVGQQLAKALQLENIPYHIIELNPSTVKSLQTEGIPVLYGDAAEPELLHSAGITKANLLIITLPNAHACEEITLQAKQLNPEIKVIARAKYELSILPLYDAGADLIIYDELETGIRFVQNALAILKVSLMEANFMSGLLREEFEVQYHEITSLERLQHNSSLILLGKLQLEWLRISPKATIVHQSLAQSGIREKTGVNVVGVICAVNADWKEAEPNLVLNAFDTLVCLGSTEQLTALRTYLEPEQNEAIEANDDSLTLVGLLAPTAKQEDVIPTLLAPDNDQSIS
jgi:CPA2 family monovalent cation:H+ antiporter-2